MALSAARNTVEREHPFAQNDERGMAATTVYSGGLVCLNAAGYLTPGATATTLIAIGVATETKTNSGAAGSAFATLRQGCFKFTNSGGDPIAITAIGDDCFIVDDETVAATNGGSTRSRAGKVIDVVSDGVFVLIGLGV